jgi:hypothetical protein
LAKQYSWRAEKRGVGVVREKDKILKKKVQKVITKNLFCKQFKAFFGTPLDTIIFLVLRYL